MKKKNGITLIALIITIIVLLILAGVSIALTIGENGILNKATKAKESTILGEEKELVNLAYSSAYTNKLGEEITTNDMQTELDNLAGAGRAEVSLASPGIFSILYTDTNHLYTVSVRTGSTIYQNIEDLASDPIVEVYANYILRQSGNLSTFSIPEGNAEHVEYDPIAAHEIVISSNPIEVGDFYYIDSNNTLNIFGKDKTFSNVKSFKVTQEVGYVLGNDGKLYMWGNNYTGRVGNGETNNYVEDIVCLNDVSGSGLYGKKVKCFNEDHGCTAIDEDGNAYTWGISDYYAADGLLGKGDTNNVLKPTCITNIENSSLYNKKIQQIGISSNNGYAIDIDGKLYMWGRNYNGEIGDGTTSSSKYYPICISDIFGSDLNNKRITKVYNGYDGKCAIDENGNLYTWGVGYDASKLGANISNISSYNKKPINISTIQNSPLNGKEINEAVIGGNYCYALDSQGKMYLWSHWNQNTRVIMPVCLNDSEGSALYGKTIKNINENDDYMIEDTNGDNYYYDYGTSSFQLYESGSEKIYYYRYDSIMPDYDFFDVTMYLTEDGVMYYDASFGNLV